MTWLSPSFPVGAFSYSSGLEWAVEAGDVVDVDTLVDWLSAMLSDGAGFCDAVFMAHAHRRASASDLAGLAEVAELAAAMVPSRERQLEIDRAGTRLRRDRAGGLELRGHGGRHGRHRQGAGLPGRGRRGVARPMALRCRCRCMPFFTP